MSASTGIGKHRSGSVQAGELIMEDEGNWFVGVDWGSQTHQVCVLDGKGRTIGERAFQHTADDLAAMADWLVDVCGAPPSAIAAAIETPHGPVVEGLMERGFRLNAINPKQLDRFRDRFSPAGAKDDRRDAHVLAHTLRTDRHCFRALEPLDPVIVELREWSRMSDELKSERTRLGNRVREQLWRFYPQLIELTNDCADAWFIDLWRIVPTPSRAQKARLQTLAAFLKRHRIRRLSAEELRDKLRGPAVTVAAGTVEAATAHLKMLAKQLDVVNGQLKEVDKNLDRLTQTLAGPQDDGLGQTHEQRDVTILRSWPGLGRANLAALLTEAPDALRRRDYHALRCLCGSAPVSKRSGQSRIVLMRRAVNRRLRNALYHWARVAMQHDPRSRAKYAALRARGKSHARALRSVGDRLLSVACTMLRNRTMYDPNIQSNGSVSK